MKMTLAVVLAVWVVGAGCGGESAILSKATQDTSAPTISDQVSIAT